MRPCCSLRTNFEILNDFQMSLSPIYRLPIYLNHFRFRYISKLSRDHITFHYISNKSFSSKNSLIEDKFVSIDIFDENEEEIIDEYDEYDEYNKDDDGLKMMKSYDKNIQNVTLQDHSSELEFIQHRIKVFESIYKEQCEARDKLENETIKIKLPDGSIKEGYKLKTTPLQIAEGISKGLAKAVIVAKVNGELWDLTRPLESDCDLILLKWDDDDAKQVFWHSSSHVLGQSMERFVVVVVLVLSRNF